MKMQAGTIGVARVAGTRPRSRLIRLRALSARWRSSSRSAGGRAAVGQLDDAFEMGVESAVSGGDIPAFVRRDKALSKMFCRGAARAAAADPAESPREVEVGCF